MKALLQEEDSADIIKHAGAVLQKCRYTQGDSSFDADISLLHTISMVNHVPNPNAHAAEGIFIPKDIVHTLLARGFDVQKCKVETYKHY